MSDVVTIAPPRPARLPLRHLVDATSLDRPLVDALLQSARDMESRPSAGGPAPLGGRILASLFFEPSTRTRLSFESAMLRLGGQVIGAQDALNSSSAAKGESLEDTVRVVSSYADVIVLRHPEVGAASTASGASAVPIINAGDGAGQHPTQALLDLYTIQAELGRISGLHVGLAGDLKHGRTARSLALLLTLFPDIELTLIAPPALRMEPDILAELRRRNVRVHEESNLQAVAPDLDVLYQTRLQRERLGPTSEPTEVPIVDLALMARLPPRAILLHPLPRVGEIDPAVEADPRAAYFRQARNGLFVRMAILAWLAGVRA
jgi:aspartate carbamoyltransferase catalytic subunit